MTPIARKSDGRRIFTDDFRRKQIDRVRSGELTLAALSRKSRIARSLLQRWKRLMPLGNDVMGTSKGRDTPGQTLGTVRYIRELQLLVGKQTVELELLRGELDALRQDRRSVARTGR